ncbi:MAG: hypothetical protein IJ366_04350 [Clostridia bacterium]|nr:hypothetical protein [Clostridia bacterium]
MRGIRVIVLAVCMLALCACGKSVKNYRVYDDLVISFTEALGDRTLKSENLTKTDDGRIITKAEYTYKSDKPDEDSQSYLYYMLNNYDATFLDEDTVTIGSKDYDCAVIIDVTHTEDTFTITITRPNLFEPTEE